MNPQIINGLTGLVIGCAAATLFFSIRGAMRGDLEVANYFIRVSTVFVLALIALRI